MFNLFQDITNNPEPTANIAYSEKEPTKNYVTARLVNPSTDITITNNNGSDTHLFTENGEFTFEFKDNESGLKGSATAKVDWIDKDVPTADVDYKLDGDKKLFIILDNISEDVYLLDKDNNKVNYIEVKDKKVSRISYLDSSGNPYKIVELDADGNTTKITYTNTTGKASNVATYVTTMEDGKVVKEEYLDSEGNPVTIKDEEKEAFSKLQQVKTNPLEYTFENSGNYEFKLLDKASNIAYKTIKVDYLENNNIMVSDVFYNITKLTNKDVVATINPYMINEEGKKLDVTVTNASNKKHKFTENGEFSFKYKDASDIENIEVKEHKAKVDWIDKVAPTATIEYSTEEPTDGLVTAHLTGESEEIVITNNNTSRKYTFHKNGDFSFEFEDAAGNIGKAIAEVDWIKQEQDEYVLGDANLDGKITATDLLLVKRHLVAGKKQEWILKENKFNAGDINKDNKITATDLLLIKRLVLKEMDAQ